MSEIRNICCVGLGYVGLPTAVVLASEGVKVWGCDLNQNAVDLINQGRAHIEEKDMDALLQQVIRNGNLFADTVPKTADAFLIAVPTPFTEDKKPDMKYVISAAEAIAPVLTAGNIIILESTSPVGSTEMVRDIIKSKRPDLFHHSDKVLFAYCPERILPGNTMRELRENSRCIGGLTQEASYLAKDVYKIFCEGELLLTNARTAEMVKLGENSFRDVNIAYANEMAKICMKNDVDVHEFIRLANHHPRVNILSPGIGVGGHCIPVDPWFLIADNPDEAQLLHKARNINDSMPEYYMNIIQNIIEGKNHGRKIAVLGLTYKPDVDDFRCSPSIDLVNILVSNKFDVKAHDFFIECLKHKDRNKDVLYCHDVAKTIEGADIVIFATPHSAYKNFSFENKIVIDPSGMIDASDNESILHASRIAA